VLARADRQSAPRALAIWTYDAEAEAEYPAASLRRIMAAV
jgi:hypothetical protein